MKRVCHVSNWKRLYNKLYGVEHFFFLFWNAFIDAVRHGILRLFFDYFLTCLVHNWQPLVYILSEMTLNTLSHFLFKVYFNIILSYKRMCFESSVLAFGFLTKNLCT
jgi:hypothetical protein